MSNDGRLIFRVLLFWAFIAMMASAQLEAPTAISDLGYSSCSRDACLFVPDSEHPKVYHHADLSYTVEVPPSDEGGRFVLRRANNVLLATGLRDLSASVLVVWSEKSDWFAVTWSDGGAIGNFHTRVFRIQGSQVSETKAVNPASREFQSRYYCKQRGDNVQAYGWDKDSGALVLVMSVYPTGDCGRDAGHMEAYFVRATDGTVLRHLPLAQLRAYMESHPVQ
jgi:hypothetical protein